MKYQVTNRHIELLNQLFDYTLKSVGLNGAVTVSNLVTVVNVVKPDPTAIIEIDENQMKALNSMSDVVLKTQGLNALGLVMELSNLLNNPLPGDPEEPKDHKKSKENK